MMGMEPETQTSKAITTTVQAVYENGVLRPLEPVNLTENARVTVTITNGSDAAKPSETAGQRKPLGGRLSHLNLKTPTLEEFEEARREMWATFPREFPSDG
jgi:predicted DNA-binding antitoxin AbrB/MazE fold protein